MVFLFSLILEEEVAVVLHFGVLVELLHEVSSVLEVTLALCCLNSLRVELNRTVLLLAHLEEVNASETLHRMACESSCLCGCDSAREGWLGSACSSDEYRSGECYLVDRSDLSALGLSCCDGLNLLELVYEDLSLLVAESLVLAELLDVRIVESAVAFLVYLCEDSDKEVVVVATLVER